MKYIVKLPAPADFTKWKLDDRMSHRPKWQRVPGTIRTIIKKSLLAEQGYICCYCERELRETDCHTEHLRPKAPSKYPQLQLDYDNLLCSCQLELDQGEPRQCGNSKGSWFEENLFISPLTLGCESKFKYTFDGDIEPADPNDHAAIETIRHLQLDIDKLTDFRKKAIEPFIDETLTQEELEILVRSYLIEKDQNNGRYNEFYTTIKYLFT